jgi:hypothetical protein
MGEQPEPGSQQCRADDREDLVAAETADELAAAGRGDDDSQGQRDQLEAGGDRRGALEDLEILGQVDDRPEQRQPNQEGDGARDGEDGIAEQAQGQDRLVGSRLPGHEQDRERDGGDGQPDDLRRAPREGGPPQGVAGTTQDTAATSSSEPR